MVSKQSVIWKLYQLIPTETVDMFVNEKLARKFMNWVKNVDSWTTTTTNK